MSFMNTDNIVNTFDNVKMENKLPIRFIEDEIDYNFMTKNNKILKIPNTNLKYSISSKTPYPNYEKELNEQQVNKVFDNRFCVENNVERDIKNLALQVLEMTEEEFNLTGNILIQNNNFYVNDTKKNLAIKILNHYKNKDFTLK